MTLRIHFGTLLLSTLIALALWGMAHGTSSIERSIDVPVVFHQVADEIVITGQSASAVNVRVLGSRAALRNLSAMTVEYPVVLRDAQPGPAVFEVDESRIDMPRGARVVSRSPSRLEITLEGKGRKQLKVRPDLEGDAAEGHIISRIEVEPTRIWLTGAHSEVIQLSEVVTEPIDVEGATKSFEKEVRISVASDHVWQEEAGPVVVRVQIDALPQESEEAGAEAPGTES
jgi:YbbR domain-containing protein